VVAACSNTTTDPVFRRTYNEFVGIVAHCQSCNTGGSDVWFVTEGASAFRTSSDTIWEAGQPVCMANNSDGWFSPAQPAAGTTVCPANQINVGIVTVTDAVATSVHTGLLFRTGWVYKGNLPVFRCTTAGTLPVGALTTTAANCAASVETGLRVR
jgi:hypothetical protein